ncbi:MAG: DUF4365 domain-containing protein [Candidatus Celaenobacter antarcticus]|nr:DUF4365 domain-containing protein [Candidatus Celaenobacter antarcticus]MDP8314716.1 DUF4365 domain-containing protein [Candidatus Celaenobacter antarcticus]
MIENDYKKFTLQARRGIKGETFFESLICDYSIPHHVVGLKDLGIDYFCEWVYGDKPSGILYAVQVKTFSEETAKPQFIRIAEGYNYLNEFEIHNSNLKIERKTLQYWQGLGIPVYLFAVVQSNIDKGKEQLNCFYKRFTPIITGDTLLKDYAYYDKFYKVNYEDSFIAFKTPGAYGFARDLFIDYVRWCYYKGSISYPNPRTLGLLQFPEDSVFTDLLKTYKERVCTAYDKTKVYLTQLGYR